MKILLATQAAKARAAARAPLTLSIIHLKLAAERAGFANDELREFSPRPGEADLLAELEGLSFDLLGLSCYVWNITPLLSLARAVKARRPDVRIVLGGPEAGPAADEILAENPEIDFT